MSYIYRDRDNFLGQGSYKKYNYILLVAKPQHIQYLFIYFFLFGFFFFCFLWFFSYSNLEISYRVSQEFFKYKEQGGPFLKTGIVKFFFLTFRLWACVAFSVFWVWVWLVWLIRYSFLFLVLWTLNVFGYFLFKKNDSLL